MNVFSCSVNVYSMKKDRSTTEAMMNDDVVQISCAQYIAMQAIKNSEIKGYRQDEVRV